MAEKNLFQNYHEDLVLEHIQNLVLENNVNADDNFIADVACVALSQLPPRYVRNRIDASYFMSEEEYLFTELKVKNAVTLAWEYIVRRRDQKPKGMRPWT